MAKTATKIGSENVEVVDISLLLLGLNKIKQEANQNLGGNEELKQELNSKIDSIVKEKEIKTVNEKINDLAQTISKSPEIGSSSEIGMMAKKIELATEELAKQHLKEVEEFKKEDFRKSFEDEAKKINPKLNEDQLKNIKDYGELIAENSFKENILDGQKNEALENNSRLFSPGKMENAWTDLKQTVNFLQKSPEEINSIKEKYNSLKDRLREVNIPSSSKEARSFEKIVESFNNPNTDQLFSRTRKYLGWADRVDKLTGGWLNKTVTDAGMKMVSKIGNQAIQEFATNSLNVIAQQGFQQGFSTVLNGILSGGVNAAATAGTTGAAVAGGTAATGAATAAGTTAAVAGGAAVSATGVGAIVVAAVAVAKVIKDVGNKIAEKLGISTKKFFEENFGKVGGKIVSGLVSIVALPTLLIGMVSATVLAPILILVMGGLFGYQILQGNLVSSLVPPKGTTDYQEISDSEEGDYINDGSSVGTYIIDLQGTKKTITYNYDPVTGNLNMDFLGQLPPSGTLKRSDLLKAATAVLGLPYFWAGGHHSSWGEPYLGIDPRWGSNDYVDDHSTAGVRHYYGLDCSGFVSWVYKQATGKSIMAGATTIYQNSEHLADNQVLPGDIAIKCTSSGGCDGSGSNHIGIYVGTGTDGKKYCIHSGGAGSHAGPEGLGGVLISTCNGNFTAFGRIRNMNLENDLLYN